MDLIILIATSASGEEQTLVCEDEFKDAGENPEDFFVGHVRDAHVAGRIECSGDTHLLSGAYKREF